MVLLALVDADYKFLYVDVETIYMIQIVWFN